MKLGSLGQALTALISVAAVNAAPAKEEGWASLGDSATDKDGYTKFNGVKVPPLLQIEGEKFSETVKNGYW